MKSSAGRYTNRNAEGCLRPAFTSREIRRKCGYRETPSLYKYAINEFSSARSTLPTTQPIVLCGFRVLTVGKALAIFSDQRQKVIGKIAVMACVQPTNAEAAKESVIPERPECQQRTLQANNRADVRNGNVEAPSCRLPRATRIGAERGGTTKPFRSKSSGSPRSRRCSRSVICHVTSHRRHIVWHHRFHPTQTLTERCTTPIVNSNEVGNKWRSRELVLAVQRQRRATDVVPVDP